MKNSVIQSLTACMVFSAASLAWGGETPIVGQKDKAFTTEKVTIKVGESVEFINNDPFYHNVFSLSDAKMFDLGSFPQGDSRTVPFETPGTVVVECAIHPGMSMTVEVQE